VNAPTDLVEQLVRLTDEQRLVVNRRAKAERRRRVAGVIRYIRRTVLANVKSHRQAADAIDDAVNGRHGRLGPALLTAIKQELRNQLGSFEHIPGPESLRKLFDDE
jgi:ribosome recycling factor